jgi:hypothetical protein
MTAEASEIDTFLQTTEPVELTDGTKVRVHRLKTREFFGLLRILTNGGAPMLAQVDTSGMSEEQMVQLLLSLTLFSLPNAQDEAIAFVQQMVELAEEPANKQDGIAARARLVAYLDNPELDDLITIVEKVVEQEAEDVRALGKRLRSMWDLAQKTGQVPQPIAKQGKSAPAKRAPSRPRST